MVRGASIVQDYVEIATFASQAAQVLWKKPAKKSKVMCLP
jgi:hypothetical protein